MSELPQKPGINQGIRDEKGRFLPGVSGHPEGKPKGVKHMTTLLNEAIRKVADDTGTTQDKAIIKALIEKAKTGSEKAIEMVFDRVDGKVESQEPQVGPNIFIIPSELIGKNQIKYIDAINTSTITNSEGYPQVSGAEYGTEIRQDDLGSLGDGGEGVCGEGQEDLLHSPDLPTGEGYSVGGTSADSPADHSQD